MAERTLDSLAEEIACYWDERAESYSNGVRGELGDERGEAWKRVLERVAGACIAAAQQAGRDARVLDLGCGPGFFTILFAEMGCRVDAVDASEEMLDRARVNVAERGVASCVNFHCSDVAALPLETAMFDVVVSRNLMWLMREPDASYAEWLRVLRPGGKLIVFDANWYRYLVDPAVDARRRLDQEGRHVKEWAENARATTAEERRCEILAADLPLTPVMRPAWDLEVLKGLNASQVRADEGAWRELWTESEQAFYATSPLFMVEALKETA